MSDHARLSPSNHRWVHCPGSIRVESPYPDTSGDAAIDGTGSHLLLEEVIEHDNADHMIDRTIGEGHEDQSQGWFIKKDRIERVNVALRYIQMRRKEIGPSTMEAESKSDPGSFFCRDDWYGTCDITLIGDRVLEVIDYKDGRGYVSEKNNSQLIAYAAGKLGHYVTQGETIPNFDCGFDKVRMTIIQPKTSNPIRYYELTPAQLWDEAQKLAIAAKATDDSEAPLVAGPHCQWCKHGRAGNCEEKNREGMEGLQVMTQSQDGQSDFITAIQSGTLNLSEMSGSQLAAIADVIPSVKKLIKMVDDELFKRIDEDPHSVVGYEMGTGNAKYVWIDEKEIVDKKLRAMRLKKDEVLIPTLISPAQARKHEGLSDRQKANLEKMIEKKPGAKKVVKSKVQVCTQEMFADVEPAPVNEIPNFL